MSVSSVLPDFQDKSKSVTEPQTVSPGPIHERGGDGSSPGPWGAHRLIIMGEPSPRRDRGLHESGLSTSTGSSPRKRLSRYFHASRVKIPAPKADWLN